ncbi:MAG TPA: DUF4349 domain-containing protein [Albitalea sp.]|uniref:DUF4349 domain-containing protein n=1 Tax=Piscinibacter sp. TaxID=1903157 RepID=UPI002ED5B8A1
MNRLGMCALACALALSACSEKPQRERAVMDNARLAQAPASPAPAGVVAAAKVESANEAPLRRFLAVRHELQIFTAADGVEVAWRQANDACAAAGCELLASTLARDDRRHPAQATLEARVPPDQLDGFLRQVSALGSVGHHHKTAEDKTDEVIDTEARLKNMAAFRDNLRRLMATPGARLKDLVEVERELVRVQSELDSLASRRKSLASQTDRAHVSLSFSAEPAVLELGMWSPVREAVVGAGHVFARSLAALVEGVVALLPWVAMVALLVASARPAWRRWRSQRAA